MALAKARGIRCLVRIDAFRTFSLAEDRIVAERVGDPLARRRLSRSICFEVGFASIAYLCYLN